MEMDSVIWLTERSQSVVVDGASSKPVSVLSGVPQGTVLGPLMFLLYINDITDRVSSTLRSFANDVSYIEKSNPHKTQYYFKRIFYYLTGLQYGRSNLMSSNV